MRLALIIRLTIGKAYYENTFRVFHHSLNRSYNSSELNSLLSGEKYFNTNYSRFKGNPYDDFLYDRVKTAKLNADSLEKNYSEPLFLNDPFTNMNHAIQEIFGVTEF